MGGPRISTGVPLKGGPRTSTGVPLKGGPRFRVYNCQHHFSLKSMVFQRIYGALYIVPLKKLAFSENP